MIRVLLVDDDALVRSGLRMMLAGAANLEVVAEADDGRHVLGRLCHAAAVCGVAIAATDCRVSRAAAAAATSGGQSP